jgi:hypothetical protein
MYTPGSFPRPVFPPGIETDGLIKPIMRVWLMHMSVQPYQRLVLKDSRPHRELAGQHHPEGVLSEFAGLHQE